MKNKFFLTPLLSFVAVGQATAAITVPFDNTSGWTTVNSAMSHTVVADPTDAGNDVGQFDWSSAGNLSFRVYDLGTGIANGTSDSIEFSFYIGQTAGASADFWFGFSDLGTGDTWADSFSNMEAYFGLREDSVGSGSNSFDVFSRNGGSGTSYDTNLAADTWHTMIISVNNVADTYDLTLNGSSLDTALGFRNGTTSNDLISFATFSNNAITSNVVLADMVVPEPSAYTLIAGALALGVVMLRRRLRC